MRLKSALVPVVIVLGLALSACGGEDPTPTPYRGAPHVRPTATPAPYFPDDGYRSEPERSYGGTTFEDYGENPFVSTDYERFSTFAMDVDTASYTIARAYVNDGHMPPEDAVRVEEFVNYFEQGYRDSGDAFTIHVDGARNPFGRWDGHLLRVGIQGKRFADGERRDAVLTFVIDVSGSMEMESRLGLVKRSLSILVDLLRDEDRVGIVTYGSSANVVLEPTRDKGLIRRAIDGLRTGGSTNAEAGLTVGYEMATRAYQEDKINRVILLSDGVANVGRTGPDAILAEVKRYANDHITLSTIGVGLANYNDVLMEKLANSGDGNYFYLDTIDEAAQLFGNGLPGLLEVIASDAKIQVEFNPAMVEWFRLVGYENRALDREDFRDDSVDAGEVGAGHSVTALYELRLVDRPRGELGRVSVRFLDPDTHEPIELHRKVETWDVDRPFRDAPGRFRFTAAVAEFAEILRDSYWADRVSFEEVLRQAVAAVEDSGPYPHDNEFIEMVEDVIALRRR